MTGVLPAAPSPRAWRAGRSLGPWAATSEGWQGPGRAAPTSLMLTPSLPCPQELDVRIQFPGSHLESTQHPLPWPGHCPQPCPLCRESCFCGDDPSRGVEVGVPLSFWHLGGGPILPLVMSRFCTGATWSPSWVRVTCHPSPSSSPHSPSSRPLKQSAPYSGPMTGPHCQMVLASPCTNKPEGAPSCPFPALLEVPGPGP